MKTSPVRVSILILLLSFTSVISASDSAEPDRFSSLYGKYSVGVKIWTSVNQCVSTLYLAPDINNPAAAKSTIADRSLKIWCWYPSEIIPLQEDIEAMSVSDYLIADLTDAYNTGEQDNDQLINFLGQKYGLKGDKRDKVLNKVTNSFRDPGISNHKFPLIVVGQGYNYASPFSQYKLCEILASNGYIVISTQLCGASSSYAGLNTADLSSASDDLLFLIGEAKRQFPENANMAMLGITGFDLGGMAAALAHMKNPLFSAIATLDAGIIMEHNLPLLKGSPYYSENGIKAPLLHITRSEENTLKMGLKENLELLEYKGNYPKYVLRIKDLKHSYLTAYDYEGIKQGDIDRAEAYSSVAYEGVLEFFKAYLGSGEEHSSRHSLISEKLKQIESRQEFEMDFTLYDRAEQAYSVRDIEFLVTREGIDKATEIIEKLVQDEYHYLVENIKEEEITSLAYNLLYESAMIPEGTMIFRMATELFPESENCFSNLGRAYILSLDYQAALDSYKRALEINPDNTYYQQIVSNLSRALDR